MKKENNLYFLINRLKIASLRDEHLSNNLSRDDELMKLLACTEVLNEDDMYET